jgi:hypothetical protein
MYFFIGVMPERHKAQLDTRDRTLALLEEGEVKALESVAAFSGIISDDNLETATVDIDQMDIYQNGSRYANGSDGCFDLDSLPVYAIGSEKGRLGELDYVRTLDMNWFEPIFAKDISGAEIVPGGNRIYFYGNIKYDTFTEQWRLVGGPLSLSLGAYCGGEPTLPAYGKVVVDGDYVYLRDGSNVVSFEPVIEKHVFKKDEARRSKIQNSLIPLEGEWVIVWQLDDEFDKFVVEQIKH